MKETQLVSLQREECFCELIDFYEGVARKLGALPTENAQFNCTKIRVTAAVQDTIFAYYQEVKGVRIEEIAMFLLQCGPKANLDGDGYLAEVEPGFFAMGES